MSILESSFHLIVAYQEIRVQSTMAILNEKLLRDALSLPVELRTELVDKLLESLNFPIKTDIEEAWAEEAEHRLEDVISGKVKPVPGEDVFKKTRARYSK